VSALKLNCTDVVTRYINTVPQLQEKLYCGYRQARCDGSSAANQYAAAYDWQATSNSYFQPNIYYNDTMGLAGTQAGRTLYQRLPEALNMAVNSWIGRTLGNGLSREWEGWGKGEQLDRSLGIGLRGEWEGWGELSGQLD
jgi:hypothetical protein